MIDGKWWLVILSAVIIALWLLASARGTKNVRNNKNTRAMSNSAIKKASPNDALQKTAMVLEQNFPDYQVTRRSKHLLISKLNKKVAMITIDKSIAAGQRRLGEVPIINYHKVPSRAQLKTNLQDAQ
ncbi:hypothetical protein [uncultured Psychrobacter sp.]|uniref:hypothetical protein n=1 Tax=uncultured Psychrobacter sp. TaxID=259303 RepID=UPI0034580D8E